jgi:hypothetical protein
MRTRLDERANHYPCRVEVVTRREFLRVSARTVAAGTASLAIAPLAAACTGSDVSPSLPGDAQLVQRFPQNLVAGEIRMPISVASAGQLLTAESSTPDELVASIRRIDGGRDDLVIENLRAPRHDANLAVPYWPFRTTITEAGFYRLVVEGGPSDGAAFQVVRRGEVQVPGIGDGLTAVETPTFLDARGVDPICTRVPEPCPLHEVSLRDALTRGVPVVLLVGTPAHCSTGTCAPALDALVSVASSRSDAIFIHAEVYADPDATRVAPVVEALGMNYEPALFVTDSSGIVVARLDAVFDEVELASVVG